MFAAFFIQMHDCEVWNRHTTYSVLIRMTACT